MSFLEVKNISKTFYSSHGPQAVFENLNLKIQKNEITALLGPSGCGKSTLLKIMAGLEKVSSGEIQRQAEAQNLSCVFQDHRLIPWRKIRSNIALPLQLARQKQDQVDLWLKKVHLEKSAQKFPFQLSGGMKMRAALARALVTQPLFVLLDEPLSALDEMTKFELQVEIRKFLKELKTTAVFVTHSIAEATFIADRVVIMSHSGEIVFDEGNSLPSGRQAPLRQQADFFKMQNHFQKAFETHVGGRK
jgi:ABC-type nitrate/sulfonate/bicarbonate transport system ATPase subunit